MCVYQVLLLFICNTIFVSSGSKNSSSNFQRWYDLIGQFNKEDGRQESLCSKDLLELSNASITDINGSNTRDFFSSWSLTSISSDVYHVTFYLGGIDLQCKLNQPNVSSVHGKTKYCLYEEPGDKIDTGMVFGYCLPESCSDSNAETIAKIVSSKYGKNDSSSENASLQCLENSLTHRVVGHYIVHVVAAVLLFLVVLATTIYVVREKCFQNVACLRTDSMKIFTDAFSMQRNFQNLFRVHKLNDISCIHSIKSCMVITVVIGHTSFMIQPFATNKEDFIDPKQIMWYIINNGSPWMSTFMVISGILTTYTTMFKFRKTRRLSDGNLQVNVVQFTIRPWLESIFYRYLRFSMFFFWIFCYAYVSPYFNEITFYPNIFPLSQCPSKIWKHLLLIHNLFYDQRCMIWTWYVAVDFQLFVFCRPIVASFIYKPRWAFMASLICILGSCACRPIINYLYDFPPSFFYLMRCDHYNTNTFSYLHMVYTKPYTYLSSYAIGLIAGYFVYKLHTKEISINLNFATQICLAIFSILSIMWNIFGIYWTANGWKNRVYDTILVTLGPVVWSLTWCWVIVKSHCFTKVALLKRFERLNIWLMLSNLTFAIYVVHFPFAFRVTFIYSLLQGGKPFIHFSNGEWFLISLFAIIVSFIVGLYFYLIVEGPAEYFLNYLVKKSSKGGKKSKGSSREMETLVSGGPERNGVHLEQGTGPTGS